MYTSDSKTCLKWASYSKSNLNEYFQAVIHLFVMKLCTNIHVGVCHRLIWIFRKLASFFVTVARKYARSLQKPRYLRLLSRGKKENDGIFEAEITNRVKRRNRITERYHFNFWKNKGKRLPTTKSRIVLLTNGRMEHHIPKSSLEPTSYSIQVYPPV